MNDYIVQ